MINLEDKNSFLNYRIKQEEDHFKKYTENSLISSLISIEINTTELCNRKCVFCPRFDSSVYPNQNLNMSVETALIISKKISVSGFKGKLSFSGFGENLLNKNFTQILKVMRENLKDCFFECNTNGDKLNSEYLKNLFDNGLDFLYINLYDGVHQIEKFEKIIKKSQVDVNKIKYRMHYSQSDYGLNINNRGGNIDWLGFEEEDILKLKGSPCYYPFYKMFVDWNGDVLFCSNDWGKEIKIGNLTKESLEEIWFGEKIKNIRKDLSVGNRIKSPCNKCSVNGQYFGKKSFEIINKFYENE